MTLVNCILTPWRKQQQRSALLPPPEVETAINFALISLE